MAIAGQVDRSVIVKKYVVARSYLEYEAWLWASEYNHERASYKFLPTYMNFIEGVPINPDDVVYVGDYKENLTWPLLEKHLKNSFALWRKNERAGTVG